MQIIKGSTRNVNVTVTTPGTPGYIYKLYVDNVLKSTYPNAGTVTETSHNFSYKFDEPLGAHVVKTELTDSCVPPMIVSASNNVDIVAQYTQYPVDTNTIAIIGASIAGLAALYYLYTQNPKK